MKRNKFLVGIFAFAVVVTPSQSAFALNEISPMSIIGCPLTGGTDINVVIPSTGYTLNFNQPDKRAWYVQKQDGVVMTGVNDTSWYLPSVEFFTYGDHGETSSTSTYTFEFWEYSADTNADIPGVPGKINYVCSFTYSFGTSGGSGDKTDRNYGHSDKSTDPNRDRKKFSPTPSK